MKKVMCVTAVIDVDLWNEATWRGTAVLSDGQSAPYLGLLFENREAAIKIFKQWNEDFGCRDMYEEIRISILQGDIQGEEHGYTVHITTNQENLLSKCKKLNLPIDETLFAIVSRYRRIETAKTNRNMETFRSEYERYLSYKIIPVYMSKEGLEPLFEYEIEKSEICFRQVGDITENDIDACCISGLGKKSN
ncbi:hypothetical protein [[Clostridium] fimetarium]|uniref:Uncharacterized protein n=1 Tax=[Clostridium] fimetarium TaxID=99656 RepID=A0A1I0QZQ7_9FIRM|nr:hypothetical protein [[Clostridium] fimetarium]SEW33375.1 hypothetical protein SAMN05421659_110102 [[Clostridium] fimetarium]